MDDLPSSSAKIDAMMERWEAMEASLELIAHELWYHEVQQRIDACLSALTLDCYLENMCAGEPWAPPACGMRK